jgi:hypothetical protein
MKAILRYLTVMTLVSYTACVNAGFLTGVVVGSALSSGGGGGSGKSPSQSGTFVFSDKHDVVVCQAAVDPARCYHPTLHKRATHICAEKLLGTKYKFGEINIHHESWKTCDARVQITPLIFIQSLGYRTIHRTGTLIQDSTVYMVFEVSK